MKNLLISIFIISSFTACKKYVKPDPVVVVPPLHNVLVLGNSITYAPANPSIGWNGSWGMAASVADSDYVHLLTARFKSMNKANELTAKNIAEFEISFDTYDFDLNLKSYRDVKPDIIIIRIGENVTRNADSVLFEKKYVALINYFTVANPKVKILAVGSVWPERDMANKVMSKYSTFISLVYLQNDLSNFSFGLFPDPSIESHPSDKGMRNISDQIWTAVQKML
ncbi:SGNH/GDSL hydrolase family protein [Mucilaginibacter sp.]|uniref:SGNH/GDSL hydrolase family protein n=1 Tax=Mucilaginibacter sp. TaxID=1882438 RepID=UPI00260C153F|nr:SGNH/GDSL hydrolase family protein [Mucilaginibacter sp.]MDB4924280.1 hypothetical protein [Mucilaginibacter sp.]